MAPTDPRKRRDRLFRIHSDLRSADNLRPDEAFDELIKLYQVWISLGPVAVDARTRRRFEIQLSAAATKNASSELWDLLSDAEPGLGAELFQELVSVGVRSGLGQYFTPQPVAAAMAGYLDPQPGEHWMDPFLGSGLLVGAIAVAAGGPLRAYGSDLDRRVIRLAEVEAELRHPESPLQIARRSALDPASDVLAAVGAPAEGVDGIVTNPPFGAVDLNGNSADYELASGSRTPIEVLGLEQAFRLLRPGGRLGIVLPQSVLSNQRMKNVREFLMTRTKVEGVLSLPGEAFAMFDGVSKASVVFARKAEDQKAGVWFGRATSVGWDSTGRAGGREDVSDTAAAMRDEVPAEGHVDVRPPSEDMWRNLTAEWQLRSMANGIPLRELATKIFTGRTPGRGQYCDKDEPGVFRVTKVANLTGRGIDWSEGERSFAEFKRPPVGSLLELGDIALTAAAHHPRYIGAKVDLVDVLPAGWEERCIASGEVLIIRVDPAKIDPTALLLWLRSTTGRSAIQACVTGQTAHLHADYVGDVHIPEAVIASDLTTATGLVAESLTARRAAESLLEAAEDAFASTIAGSAV